MKSFDAFPDADRSLNDNSGFGDFIKKVSRLPIGNFPTPVRAAVAVADPGFQFWIKDDGQCSSVYGGNKVRKLEYLLAEIQRRQKQVLVVHGDVESHTVQACGIWGTRGRT